MKNSNTLLWAIVIAIIAFLAYRHMQKKSADGSSNSGSGNSGSGNGGSGSGDTEEESNANPSDPGAPIRVDDGPYVKPVTADDIKAVSAVVESVFATATPTIATKMTGVILGWFKCNDVKVSLNNMVANKVALINWMGQEWIDTLTPDNAGWVAPFTHPNFHTKVTQGACLQ